MCVFCLYMKMFVKCMCKCIVSQVWMLQCVVLNENIWLFCGFTCEWVLFGCVCAFMNVVCVCIHVLIYSGRKVLLLSRSSISFFCSNTVLSTSSHVQIFLQNIFFSFLPLYYLYYNTNKSMTFFLVFKVTHVNFFTIFIFFYSNINSYSLTHPYRVGMGFVLNHHLWVKPFYSFH